LIAAILFLLAALQSEALSDSTVAGRTLTDAVRVIPMAGGRRLALVRLPGIPQDPTAVGAVMLSPDGRTWPLRASMFVEPELMLAGSAGQIYGGAMSDDQTTAALSIGWLSPAREGRNGIIILQKGGDQLFHQKQRIECRVGTGDLLFTPQGDIVAVTAPYVTVFTISGKTNAELLHGVIGERRRASELRLYRAGNERYALLDVVSSTLYLFAIGRTREITTTDLDPHHGTLGPIQAIAFDDNSSIVAVRQQLAPRPDTVITLRNTTSTRSMRTGSPSRTAYFHDGMLSLVASIGGSPSLQHLSLADIRKGARHD